VELRSFEVSQLWSIAIYTPLNVKSEIHLLVLGIVMSETPLPSLPR